jgi:hypothetical protein
MSNALALAAVTATLRARVFAGLGNIEVTVVPPDRAPTAVNADHVNLFLYRADLHGTFRNADPPGSRPGTSPRPLLPLVLHYLLSSYSNDEGTAQELLGAAMLALHERPVLRGEEILGAVSGRLPGSDLHLQAEQVKITYESLSQDDIAKMWTAFGTPFRMSAAYQVSVVLIESALGGTSPLPVLTRGANDRGPVAQPGLDTPYPALGGVGYALAGQVAALPGETVTVPAVNLPAGALVARLRHLRLPAAAVTVPVPAPAAGVPLAVGLPAAALPAGPWALSVAPAAGGPGLVSNEVPVAVRPEVSAIAVAGAGGNPARTTVTVTAAQPVRRGQRAAIAVGSRQLPVPLLAADTSTPAVTAVLPPGTYRVRLLVDDVESELVDRATGAFRAGPAVEVVVP